jgi:arginine exporter protein ArgO
MPLRTPVSQQRQLVSDGQTRPMAWRLLDGLIGVTMFVLAAMLVRHALGSV